MYNAWRVCRIVLCCVAIASRCLRGRQLRCPRRTRDDSDISIRLRPMVYEYSCKALRANLRGCLYCLAVRYHKRYGLRLRGRYRAAIFSRVAKEYRIMRHFSIVK